MPIRPAGVAALLTFAISAAAQSNTVPGLDLRLEDTWALAAFQRSGTYPNGQSAIGAWTTCCNPGSVAVPFQAAMNPDHAFIHYIVAREANGRFEQISNWSWVKHTFGSSNDPSSCGTCAGPGRFSWVEVGCSDTYANYQAVDHYNLGPADEIDPWLGTWVPQCSYFDRGNPAVGGSQMCDNVRSLTHNQANALNQGLNLQMRVADNALNVAGASYWYQSGYLVPAEAEANRWDNIGSRQFTPTWNGSAWDFTDGNSYLHGTVLQRWSGAQITSNRNGTDDGRYYVAVKVTGPVRGLWHYEYAVHNRDNRRGLGALRIPVCSAARVENLGFHDVDSDPLNQWTPSVANGEIAWQTNGNPLRWNSIFNFWFDCDAAPVVGSPLALDQYAIGPGALTVAVVSTAPLGLYDQFLGPGCGSPLPPVLFAEGNPARPSLGNASFALRAVGNPANVLCGFVLTLTPGTTALGGGCTLYSAGFGGLLAPFLVLTDGAGAAAMPLAIPSSVAFEGLDLDFQAANVRSAGAYQGTFDLSNGLRVRIGSQNVGCP
jgi:hypothetical protein